MIHVELSGVLGGVRGSLELDRLGERRSHTCRLYLKQEVIPGGN